MHNGELHMLVALLPWAQNHPDQQLREATDRERVSYEDVIPLNDPPLSCFPPTQAFGRQEWAERFLHWHKFSQLGVCLDRRYLGSFTFLSLLCWTSHDLTYPQYWRTTQFFPWNTCPAGESIITDITHRPSFLINLPLLTCQKAHRDFNACDNLLIHVAQIVFDVGKALVLVLRSGNWGCSYSLHALTWQRQN